MGFTDRTVVEVLAEKTPPERKPHCSTLESYEEKPVIIPVYMTEDVVKSVAQKRSGSTGPGGTESDYL